MRIFKTVLSTLLCGAVLVLCAFLPRLSAALQDIGTDHVVYADIEPVSLKIRELTVLEKLGCFTDSATVFLPDYQANTKRETLPDVIAKEMYVYQDVGLVDMNFDFTDMKMWYMEASLAMCYNTFAPEKNALFWFVQMSSSYYGETNLQLVLDDSTGAILFIDFQTETPSYSDNSLYDALMRFYIVYFERLDTPLERVSAIELEPVEISKKSIAMEFGWDDETFGWMVLNFQMNDKGFFVNLMHL